MGWKQDRKEIQNLMNKVNSAKEGSDAYRDANRALNEALAQQPVWRRANALYHR